MLRNIYHSLFRRLDSSIPENRKLYAISEQCHPANFYDIYRNFGRHWSKQEASRFLLGLPGIGFQEIKVLQSLEPSIIFKEGVSRFNREEIHEHMKSDNYIEEATVLMLAPELIYRDYMGKPCKVIYLDEEFVPYKQKSQNGREKFWTKIMDENLSKDSKAVIIVGSGHIDSKPTYNTGNLLELLSKLGIDIEISYRTKTLAELARDADVSITLFDF